MKKKMISLAVWLVLTVLVVMGLRDPQSIALNFLALWAWVGSVIAIAVTAAGVGGHLMWRCYEQGRVEEAKSKGLGLARAAFPLRREKWRQVVGILVPGFVIACLVAAGWIITSIVYLFCLGIFWFARSVYLKLTTDGDQCSAG